MTFSDWMTGEQGITWRRTFRIVIFRLSLFVFHFDAPGTRYIVA